MRTLLTTLIILIFLHLNISAQNSNYRVEKIVNIQWNNKVDTFTQNYEYKNSLLSQVQILKGNNVDETYSYTYEGNKITETNKRNKVDKYFLFDGNNRLQEYQNDICDNYKFTYSDTKIQTIDRKDKCMPISEGYDFEYVDNKLSKVKAYVKPRSFTTDYVFSYENDKIDKIAFGKTDVYSISWKDNKIDKIVLSRFGKPISKNEYIYDESGKIKEETIYSISEEKEILSEKFFIVYSANKGNDNFIWSVYNWKINILANQRTYKKFQQVRF